jgi:predicted permease
MIRPGIRHLFRLRLRRAERVAQELDEELEAHLTWRAAQLEAQGLSPEAARVEAERRFGPVAEARRELLRAAEHRERRVGVRTWLADLRQDLRAAWRSVTREPGFAAVVIVVIALGVGANAAMFGIVDRLLVSGPAHVADPGSLRRVYVTTRNDAGGETTTGEHAYALYQLVRDDISAFSGVGGYTWAFPTRIGTGPDAPRVPAAGATATFFGVLGVHPALGRFFLAAEDEPPSGEHVAVLSYRLWMRAFAGDTAVLGREISLGGEQYTVVGVAPRDFTGAERAPVDVWTPISACCHGTQPTWASSWNAWQTRIVARLKPASDVRLADAQMTAALAHGYTGHNPLMRDATVSARPLGYTEEGVEPREAGISRLLYGVSAMMLLVAVANVANLLLARAIRRRRELGIRRALGAGRVRLVRLLLAEALALAVLGGVAGVLVGDWGGVLIGRALYPGIPWESSPFDGRVLLYTAAAVVLTALFIGVLPALRSAHEDLRSCLSGGETASDGRARRPRAMLQVAQVALSVVLLSTAGLFVRSLLHIRTLDLGLHPDSVLAVHVVLPRASARSDTERNNADLEEREQFRSLLDALSHVSGVESASLMAGSIPFWSAMTVPIRPGDKPSLPAARGGGPYTSAITADYFRTVGTRVLRGRAFRPDEHEGTAPVTIVNETMARVVWPGEDPLGKCLEFQFRRPGTVPCARIVGVVADEHRHGLREVPAMQTYVPFGQAIGTSFPALFVRPVGDASAFVTPLRRTLERLAPSARIAGVSVLGSALEPQIRPWRVGTMVFGLFGLAALAVAAVGLFTVVSYLVTRQQRELGVRIALGASSSHVIWMVLRRALTAAALGTGIGAMAVIAIAPAVQPLLFDIPARDPALIALVVIVLVVSALVASAMPAMRASRVDPITVLRSD